MSFELEQNEDQPPPMKGIAFTTHSKDERVKKLKADVNLMVKSVNNMVKRLDKEASRSLGRYKKRGNQRNSRTYGERQYWKKEVQCHECEGYAHFQRECPLFKKKK